MSGLLTPEPRLREFSDLGVVLPGAKLYTYVAGTPSTPLATYSDVALTTPNANPVVASAGGLFGPIYLTPGVAYKFLLKDASDVTVPGYPQDNISVPALVTVPLTVAGGGTGAVTWLTGGVLYGNGAGALGITAAGVAGQVLATPAATPLFVGGLTLLRAFNGSSNAAGGTTVDSIVIPASLTANDTLVIEYYAESLTQQTTTPGLYHVTDAADLLFFASGGSIPANGSFAGRVVLKQRQGSAVGYVSVSQGMSGGGVINNYAIYAATALWTAGWTLGLRHAGVTAGGTFRYQWSVYRLGGQ